LAAGDKAYTVTSANDESTRDPTAWQLGLGLLLVVIALFARNGIIGIAAALRRPAHRAAS